MGGRGGEVSNLWSPTLKFQIGPCLLLAFQCIATIKDHDLWVSGVPSRTLETFKWVIKSWEIDLGHFIQLKKYYIHWYSPYGPQKKIHCLMIKLHICYRLKSIYPMTYLDNTFPNSSATQAQISYHLDYYMLPIHQFFKNSICRKG